MRDVDLALSQISSIRAHLAASTRFLGIAPCNVLTGALVLVVAIAQSLQPQTRLTPEQYNLHYAAVWGAVLAALSVVAAVKTIPRARRLHGDMALPMLSVALQRLLPVAATGGVVTCVICMFSPETAWLLPGLWLLLIGLFGFTVIASVPRGIIWPAVWYFICGGVVLGLAAHGGALSPWMMGIPLVAGQTLVASILARTGGEDGVRE